MPRNKKHDVWENYSHSATNKSVKCKHCDKVYKFANVSKMKNHLFKCFKCPSIIKIKLRKTSASSATTTKPLVDVTQHSSLVVSSSTTSTEISSEKKLHLDQLLSKAIFVTGSPLSIVEHPLWVRFFKEVQPLYKLPSRKAISTAHLESIYNETLKEVKEELKSANNLHLQCDGWSNRRDEGIINLIIAKPEPVFVETLNIFTNRYTTQYISKEILEVMNVYGSHKFVSLIGDNNTSIQSAFQIVKDTHPQVLPLRCVAHTLHLLCEDCLKQEPIKAFISLAIETIKAVNNSQSMSVSAHNVKSRGSGLILELPEKWGSYCAALKSLKNSKVPLQTIAVHEGSTISETTKSNLLDETFWSMTEDCIKLLEPITDKIFQLEGNGILINEVYMAFRDIKTTLTEVLPKISILNVQHKDEIINVVIRRINSCIKPIYCAAYLLDPRSQGVELEEEHEVDAMEFIHEMSRSLNIDISVDIANYRAKHGFWARSFFWESVAEINPVVWWKGLCRSKLLSEVAVRILTAPCTSVATERSYSIHAHIPSQQRAKLTTDTAKKIEFISHNWALLHKNKDHNNDEPSSTPGLVLSSRTSPMYDKHSQPSTSRINKEDIEFCDINAMPVECCYNDSSDSD